MRKIGLMNGGTLFVAGGLAVAMATPAMAAEPSSREQQMEQRLRELEAQVERLTEQLERGETSALSARVAELEATVAAGKGTDLGWYWDNGLKAASAGGDFKFHIGGRTQVDFFYPDVDGDVERANGEQFEDGVRFRRARLHVAGTIHEHVGFMAEYDFAGGDADFRNVWMSLKHPCVGKIKVGHFKEPFGFEELTSSRFITTMERGAAAAVAPGYNTGIAVSNNLDDGRWNWSLGVFRQSDSYGDDRFNVGSEEWNWTGRIAGVAWEDEDAGRLLHTGFSVSHRNPNRVAPTTPPSPPFTGAFAPGVQGMGFQGAQAISATGLSAGGVASPGVDDGLLLGGDVAYITDHGYSVWVDYVRADFDSNVFTDAEISALRVAAAYTLHGEPRRYNRKKNNFDRPTVGENYGDGDGLGAWELVGAFDDYRSSGFSANDGTQYTAGVNWWLNPNTKVMLNVFRGHIQGVGQLKGLGMRFQIDF